MNDFNREAMISSLSALLAKSGLSPYKARKQATEEVDSMGATKTLTGTCPRGGFNPMACMFCPYGHMTDCHWPLTCEEAECSHYQQEMELEDAQEV